VATGIVFAVGVFATAATSPSQTSVKIAPATGSVSLDAEHPAALTRISVRLDEVATAGGPRIGLHLATSNADVGAAARFIVLAAVPGADPREFASPGTGVDPLPSAWQAEARPGYGIDLPLQCGDGPCERAFWLIGQLVDPSHGPLQVDWTVDGSVTYLGNSYPSGGGASVVVDPPIPVSGEIPQLIVTTAPEALALGPERPAAARVLEVRLGADAIPTDGSPVGTLTLEVIRTGSGGSGDRRPIVQLYTLDGDSALVEPGVDPFAGCKPGSECIRRFLVSIAAGGDKGAEETFRWSATVRRVDLVRAWSSPARLSAAVTQRFDIDPDSRRDVAHLEGRETTVTGGTDAQLRLSLATTTTSDDPIAALLPVPATMTYHVSLVGVGPQATSDGGTFGNISPPGPGNAGISFSIGDAGSTIVTNPLTGCRLGEACPDLTIKTYRGTSGNEPRPPVDFEWSLDVSVYSYVEVPVAMTVDDHRP
jgi:hypothetical protein